MGFPAVCSDQQQRRHAFREDEGVGACDELRGGESKGLLHFAVVAEFKIGDHIGHNGFDRLRIPDDREAKERREGRRKK